MVVRRGWDQFQPAPAGIDGVSSAILRTKNS